MILFHSDRLFSDLNTLQVSELEESDAEIYNSELSDIASISRENLNHVMPLLHQLLLERKVSMGEAIAAGRMGMS
jgi:hypothetical protein